MKRKPLRLLALALAMLLFFGCSTPKAPVKEAKRTTTAPAATQPSQQQLEDRALQELLQRAEYSLMAAAFFQNEQVFSLKKGYIVSKPACVTDVDRNGSLELIYGTTGMMLYLQPQRSVECGFTQSGFTYYTDREGRLYQSACIGDSFQEQGADGRWVQHEYYEQWYDTWEDGGWKTGFRHESHASYPQIGEAHPDFGATVDFDAPFDKGSSAEIWGESCTMAQLEAHLDEIGLQKVETGAWQLTKNTCPAIYTDHLLTQLDGYFAQSYPGYGGSSTADIDGDGQAETLFFVSAFDRLWYDHTEPGDEFGSFAQSAFIQALQEGVDRTGVLVADPQGDTLVLQALCCNGTVGTGSQLALRGGFLWVDDRPVQIPGVSAPEETDTVYLTTLLESLALTDSFMLRADVAQQPGQELLVLCLVEDTWRLVVFARQGERLACVYILGLYNSAIYVVEHQGQQCLLLYGQHMYSTMDGKQHTNYDYSLVRPGSDKPLDYRSVGYSSDATDASKVADFFAALQQYLKQPVVVFDPYRLTGRMWPTADSLVSGTPPAEPEQPEQPEQQEQQEQQEQPEQPEQQEQPVMGFVQINDPASWLNLRTGPGTEHPCVEVDGSIVKQALGSPVTVLATVQTDDPNNPVWLKVRITYENRQIEGYSSKTYIHIPE